VSIATPYVSPRVFARWFALPNLFLLLPIPLLSALLFARCENQLRRLRRGGNGSDAAPFRLTVGRFVLVFIGLAYSLFPYLVVDRITIWEAAAAPASLRLILIGALVTLPMITAYTIYSYRVFGGKARTLEYKRRRLPARRRRSTPQRLSLGGVQRK